MSDQTQRAAPIALWRIVHAFITTFFSLFGAPEAIAAQHTLSAKAYALALDWLRAGEALVRRLLLIEAAACEKPDKSSLLRPHRIRAREAMSFDAEHPEKWRVSFRCLRRDTHAHAERTSCKPDRRACVSPQCFHSAWPLAERAEAMLRVFNNPAPYAARLARRLHAAPHRSGELLAYPQNAPGLVGHQAFADTDAPARHAHRRFEPG